MIFNTELNTVDMLQSYQNQLPMKPFDLAILGMGEDGHIASIFDIRDCAKQEPVFTTHTSSTPPISERVTVGWDQIATSRAILVLTKGAKKLERLLNPMNTPAQLLLELPQTTLLHSIDS